MLANILSYGIGTLIAFAIIGTLAFVFIRDITQKKHSVLRNYPVIGRLRYKFEELGEYFRHRMGHGIGLDVHEEPLISVEDRTRLEAGMTFTDEPSIEWTGLFGVRIEDIVVCAEGGARRLTAMSTAPLLN